jgi:RND family efflux transporter MFP subunit
MHITSRVSAALHALLLANFVAGTPAAADGRAPAGTPALTVTVAQPLQTEWPETIAASGAVEAWQEASVGAQVGGQRISEVLAEVGDVVERGQVLARLDTEVLNAELRELEAALLQAEASLAEAHANRERAERLRASGAMSEQEILQFVTRAAVAEAQVAAARARIDSQRLRLRFATIVAPDAGAITARSAMLGAITQVGEELFRMIRQQRLEWRGELTAEQLGRVATGAAVELELPNGGKARGTVRTVAPTMTPGSRLGIVYVDLDPGSPARAGMYAAGIIQLAPSPALVVPAASVVIRDGRSIVFTLERQAGPDLATIAARFVTLGRRRQGQVEVLGGIDTGDRLVEQGAGFLSDGDLVRIVERSRPAAESRR